MLYDRFEKSELILRDELAIDRTILSIERTVLAYLRSSVSLVLAGLTILGLITTGWFKQIGYICIPLGIGVGIFGIIRSIKMKYKIQKLRKNIDDISNDKE